MQTVLRTLLVLAVLAGVFYTGYQARVWKHDVEHDNDLAVAAAKYLFEPTDVLGTDGKPLRRVDLIDGVLAKAYAPKK